MQLNIVPAVAWCLAAVGACTQRLALMDGCGVRHKRHSLKQCIAVATAQASALAVFAAACDMLPGALQVAAMLPGPLQLVTCCLARCRWLPWPRRARLCRLRHPQGSAAAAGYVAGGSAWHCKPAAPLMLHSCTTHAPLMHPNQSRMNASWMNPGLVRVVFSDQG
jgi:hypothetical protein